MYCNFCGKEIEENSRFCNYCGNRLEKELREQENTKQDTKESLRLRWQKAGEQVERENKEKELMKLEEMQKEIEKNLKPKDGKHHIVLIKSQYGYFEQGRYQACDNQYVLRLENILEMIQNKGYEIVDIKIIGIQESWGATERIEAIVVYK